ncbi:MAG: ComEA family DNA-binding protein [Gemmataceae bacterium]
MDAASSPVGVVAASPTPLPQWPAGSSRIEPPSDLSVRLKCEPVPAWSRPAQGTAVLLLVLALGLLGWHSWIMQCWNCRPTALETGALDSPSLDLNQADHAQLLQLSGVGEDLARRIEAYRAEHHGFRDVDELGQVKGIGAKRLEKLRPFLYVETPVSDEEESASPVSVRPLPAQVEKEKQPLVSSKKEPLTARIDVNHATAADLCRLPGIGKTLSQRIIETRTQKPFHSMEDLRRVRGIGAKTLERLRPHVIIVP